MHSLHRLLIGDNTVGVLPQGFQTGLKIMTGQMFYHNQRLLVGLTMKYSILPLILFLTEVDDAISSGVEELKGCAVESVWNA